MSLLDTIKVKPSFGTGSAFIAFFFVENAPRRRHLNYGGKFSKMAQCWSDNQTVVVGGLYERVGLK